jgi:hypothetical protein
MIVIVERDLRPGVVVVLDEMPVLNRSRQLFRILQVNVQRRQCAADDQSDRRDKSQSVSDRTAAHPAIMVKPPRGVNQSPMSDVSNARDVC